MDPDVRAMMQHNEQRRDHSVRIAFPGGRRATLLRRAIVAVSVTAMCLLSPRMSQGQSVTHILEYTPPPTVFRLGLQPAEDYSFTNANGALQVYQFRPFTGNILQAFQTTLLRDWIAPLYQEENIGAPPTFLDLRVQGADRVVTAVFTENRVGLPRPHNRMLIIAGNEAAVVDASAATMESWGTIVPALQQMVTTFRVSTARAPAPLSRAAGLGMAGLYQGMKQKYMATSVNITGAGYYQNALHYYLFSPDGRFYRAYDRLDVPGGMVSQFDFDAAERNDPMNSGRYTIDGGKLILKTAGSDPRTIVTDAPADGIVKIESVVYTKK